MDLPPGVVWIGLQFAAERASHSLMQFVDQMKRDVGSEQFIEVEEPLGEQPDDLGWQLRLDASIEHPFDAAHTGSGRPASNRHG